MKLPHVKCLGVHENTEFITEVHELDGRHVMGSAHSVHTHRKKREKLPFGRCPVDSRAKRTEIVVHAGAVELSVAAV